MTLHSPLWAITSYFNPGGYRRRRHNYHEFRRRLSVPLLTVELTFGGEEPALSSDDADIFIRCADGDVMWQKERLLNLAVERLPPSCRQVAWIDCDVIFEDGDWAARTSEALENKALVQPYSLAHHAPRDADVAALAQRNGWSQRSIMAMVHGGLDCEAIIRAGGILRSPERPSLGMAWAARRELLETHGLYDRCIVGGGDTVLVCAALGCPEAAIAAHEMNAAQQAAYLQWAQAFHADVQGRASHLPGVLHHLWHGDMADRQAKQRHQRLAPHGFEPASDLAPGSHGAWRWACDKPSLKSYVHDYFCSRHEDGRAETLLAVATAT